MSRPLTLLARIAVVTAALAGTPAMAQQAQDFGDYVVHYNAMSTSLLPPQVAQGYDIQRSSSRALINVTVLGKVLDTPGTPVSAKVEATAVNLTGQQRQVELREIEDQGAIYYIGVMSVRNMETYTFTVNVTPEGETEPLLVKFRQQFYTD